MASHVPTLRLSHFDGCGGAETIRKVLNLGGVSFEDRRVSKSQKSQELEAFLPFAKLPVIEVDGQVFAGTQAIQRFSAQLAGLYPCPDDPIAALLVDEVVDTFEDVFNEFILPTLVEQDNEILTSLRRDQTEDPLLNKLLLIDSRLRKIDEYLFARNDPSMIFLHEVVVWYYVDMFRSGTFKPIPVALLDQFKTLIALHDKVAASPPPYQSQPSSVNVITPKPTKLKLTYFDYSLGRAGHIRYALHVGGIEFEDERLTREQFWGRKHLFPYEQVPVLEIDGCVVGAQTFSLSRFAGRITGLYPQSDPLLAMKIDEVICHIDDLELKLDPSFREKDPEKRRILRVQISENILPTYLGQLDKRLAHWKQHAGTPGSKFALGGDGMTIADLMIHNLFLHLVSGYMSDVPKDIGNSYQNLVASYKAVKDHPRVLDWDAQH